MLVLKNQSNKIIDEWRSDVPFRIKSLSEKNVISKAAVHDPRLLRDVSKRAVDGHPTPVDFHVTENGRQQGRFTRSHRSADCHQMTLKQINI
jgi:hypothetical protein